MKKIVGFLLMVVLAMSCLPVVPAAAWDYDYYYDKYYYIILVYFYKYFFNLPISFILIF